MGQKVKKAKVEIKFYEKIITKTNILTKNNRNNYLFFVLSRIIGEV